HSCRPCRWARISASREQGTCPTAVWWRATHHHRVRERIGVRSRRRVITRWAAASRAAQHVGAAHLTTRRGRGSMRAIRPEGVARMAEWKAPTQDRVDGYFKELNNWGRWGNDDQKGTVNLITAAKRQSALGFVKTGRTVSLARDVVPMPVFMYHATFPSERERADVVLDRFDMVYHGFWITHIDALCHVGWDREIYNGRSFKD